MILIYRRYLVTTICLGIALKTFRGFERLDEPKKINDERRFVGGSEDDLTRSTLLTSGASVSVRGISSLAEPCVSSIGRSSSFRTGRRITTLSII